MHYSYTYIAQRRDDPGDTVEVEVGSKLDSSSIVETAGIRSLVYKLSTNHGGADKYRIIRCIKDGVDQWPEGDVIETLPEFQPQPSRFRHRKPDSEEFNALMKRADMNVHDFAAITGRHVEDIVAFLRSTEPVKKEGASRTPYVPRIGDILLLELAARDNAMVDDMIDIVNSYALDDAAPRKKEETPDRYWG